MTPEKATYYETIIDDAFHLGEVAICAGGKEFVVEFVSAVSVPGSFQFREKGTGKTILVPHAQLQYVKSN